MNAPVLSRRALVQAGAAALGAALVPAGITAALAAEPSGFDPEAYVADLEAIGCRVSLLPPIRPCGQFGPWTYSIGSPEGRGFGETFREVMQRWSTAIEACPDHGDRVTAYLTERDGAPS